MKCKTSRCKNDNLVQSRFARYLGWCVDCEKFSTLTDDDLATLDKDGGLRYEEYQRVKAERQERVEQNLEKTTRPSRTKSPKRKRTKKSSKKRSTSTKKKTSNKKKSTTPKKKTPKKTKCDEHPNYGVIRKPRTDCKMCWELYSEKFPERVKN